MKPSFCFSRQTHLRRRSQEEEEEEEGEGDPAAFTKQIMAELDSGAYGGGGGRPPPPKGLPSSDVRYVQDLQYSRTLIACTDEDAAAAATHPPHCVCPPRGSAVGPPCAANPSCRIPVAMPPDVYSATKRPIHLYEMPETT